MESTLGFRMFSIAIFYLLFFGFSNGMFDKKNAAVKKVAELKVIADSEAIKNAVIEQNKKIPVKLKKLDNITWQTIPETDPLVQKLMTNTAATELRKLIRSYPFVAEAFVSDREGRKVGFVHKSKSFIHKGKPMHEVPMRGRTWISELENSSSDSGLLQIAIPILDEGKPIGSLLLGVEADKIK